MTVMAMTSIRSKMLKAIKTCRAVDLILISIEHLMVTCLIFIRNNNKLVRRKTKSSDDF